MTVQVQLYDANWQPVSVLLEASPREISRIRRNEAVTFRFTVPAESVNAADLALAANVLLMGRIPGRITGRRINEGVIEIEGISAEDLLNGWRTPHNWPYWENRDLADVVRDVLNPFRLIRMTQFVQNGWHGRWWRRTAADYNVLDAAAAANVDTLHPTLDLTDYNPAGQADYFNGRIEGWIIPAYSEAYTLYLTHDDGARLWFDDTLAIDAWVDGLATHSYTTPVLTAGKTYHVVIECYERTGTQQLKLEWQSASQARQVIPQTAVRPDLVSSVPYEAVDVDLQTHFGNVVLATDPYLGAKRYRASGYVTFRLQLPATALATGRYVRWTESVGTVTHITVQTRSAATEAGLATASWTTPFEAVHASGFEQNETYGVPIADGGQWVDIRFNLSTEDRDTPDDETYTTIFGFTPVLGGIEVIYREPGPIAAGSIPTTTGVTVRDYTPSRLTALRVLNELCEKYDYSFRVRLYGSQLKLDLAQTFGVDRSADVRLIARENCLIESLSDTDQRSQGGDRQITVLHVWGKGQGADRPHVIIKDDTLVAQKGWIEDDYELPDVESLGELQRLGQAEFDKRKNPFTEAVVSCALETLGNAWLEDKVALVLPDSHQVAVLPIEELSIEDTAQGGEIARVGLGAPVSTLIDAVVAAAPKPTGSTPPPPDLRPPEVRAQGDYQTIILSWPLVPGADAYDVEHSTDGTTWQLLASDVPGLRYEHRNLVLGSTHYYRVWPKRGGTRGPVSATVRAIAADKTPPANPTGVVATSILRGISVRCNQPPEPDWATTEVEVWDGVQWLAKASGRQTRFEIADLEAGKTYKARVRHVDRSGNTSAWVESGQVVAGKVTVNELSGEVLNLKADSDDGTGVAKPPATGKLSDLWDADLTTGATWTAGPVRITFTFPTTYASDLVRIYAAGAYPFTAEAMDEDTGTWTTVIASGTTAANAWTVKQFDSSKLVHSRHFRITLNTTGAVDLRHCRFKASLAADELLAQTIRLTDNMYIESADGSTQIKPGIVVMQQPDVGKTEFGPGGLKFFQPDPLNPGAYKANPWQYLRGIVIGEADDGVPISLPFTTTPKIFAIPTDIRTYSSADSSSSQRIITKAEIISPSQVVIHCALWKDPGTQQFHEVNPASSMRIATDPELIFNVGYTDPADYFVPCDQALDGPDNNANGYPDYIYHNLVGSVLDTAGQYWSGRTSLTTVTKLSVRVKRNMHMLAMRNYVIARVSIVYRLEYKLASDTTWTLWADITATQQVDGHAFWIHETVTHEKSGLPAGQYDVRVTLLSITTNDDGGVDVKAPLAAQWLEIDNWTEYAMTKVQSARAMFVAVEGGE